MESPGQATRQDDDVVIVEDEGFSRIWIVPIIALLVGMWLAWQHYVNRPLAVTLHFPSGDGIVVGKTEVRFEGISVGTVMDMAVNAKRGGVDALIEMDRRMEPSLKDSTQFWLVKPEVSFSGISGLDTLITGNYIGMKVGEGVSRRSFDALASTPPMDETVPGLHLVLNARDLGSLHPGSPVNFRRITVGAVSQYALDPEGKGVIIKVFIKPEYAGLVKKHSRFWNSSGIKVSGSLSGIDVKLDSLASLVAGGISFDTPSQRDAQSAISGDTFTLHDDFEAARAGLTAWIRFPDARGIDKLTTVLRYKGFMVGDVKSVTYEKSSDAAIVKVTLDPRYEHFLVDGTRFWLVKPELSLSQISGLDTLITGAFIEVLPGEGAAQTRFEALSEPPKIDASRNGLRVRLTAAEMPAIARGSPVFFRRVPVGEVESFELARDGTGIVVHLFIHKQHAGLVKKGSRFWNMSGISLKGGLDGVEIKTGTLQSMLVGGIGFHTPSDATDRRQAVSGDQFRLYEDHAQASEQGLDITITFPEGNGLEVDAPLKYQGIAVGRVKKVALSDDLEQVVVTAHLNPSAVRLARAGSRFWVVKPKLGLGGATNLDTLIRGLYLAVEPGMGPQRLAFEGLAEAPVKAEANTGLNILIWARQRGSVEQGSRVYYRQVPIGEVRRVSLADTADSVVFHVNIEPRYMPLVRQNSVFWNASGVQLDVSLFKGASIRTESLESVLKGGISLATPEVPAPMALPGSAFRLAAAAEDDWLKWKPVIRLNP